MKGLFRSSFIYLTRAKRKQMMNEMNLWLMTGFSDSIGTIAMVAVQVLDALSVIPIWLLFITSYSL